MADTSAFQDAPQGVGKLKTASELTNKLDGLKRDRALLETQWKLNLAFYRGKQYTYFNKSANRLQQLPVEDGEKPRYRVRLVNNQILTGSHSLLSKLTKTKPVIAASPQSSSDEDIKAAQLAEQLLKFWWTEFHLDDKLEEALLWTIITGQGYWKIEWDKYASKGMKFLLDPQGQPITDEEIKTLFRTNLEQMGVQPLEETVYLGDIKVSVPSPFTVFLDPSAKVFEEAKWAICVHYLDPDEARARYGKGITPDANPSDPADVISIAEQDRQNASEATLVTIYEGYFLPTPGLPNGRYVIWTKDKILEDTKWPYPHRMLPVIKFPGVRVPGSIYDSSTVEHAIPLQKELNKTLSQIVEYKNLTVKPRVWAPTGALAGQRLTSEPGAVFEYNPIGEHRPEIEKMPAMQAYVFEHLDTIRNSLREVFGLTEVSEGTVPPNVEAGVAIDLLQEMSTDRIAPTIKLVETALGRAGNMMLQYAQEYYAEPRMLQISGPGGSTRVKKFSKADLQGGVSVVVESGSALPRTRAGRQARIMQYLEQGIIRPEQAYKYLDIADLEGVAAQFKADEDQAMREHDKLLTGGVINPFALQSAQAQLQAGQVPSMSNPEQPMSDPQEMQEFLRLQSLQPLPHENMESHLEAHALWMKSVEFEGLPPEVQQNIVDHYNATRDALLAQPQPIEFQAVRPTLQIKATAGPTAVSDILQKAGVDVTPEEMTEPPLETWVSDSVDKPDADAAGPGQEGNELSQTAQIMMQATIADMQAKQNAVIKDAEAGQQQASSEVEEFRKIEEFSAEQARKDEMHQIALEKAVAEADLAKKKASQSDFTPKPKGESGGKK